MVQATEKGGLIESKKHMGSTFQDHDWVIDLCLL